MTIVLDLDDVLANLRESLYQVMFRATGIDNHWRNWRHYDLTRHFATDYDAVHDILREQCALERCQPEPDAVATTQALHALGYSVTIVTARGWHAQAHELTQTWLDQHRFHYDDLAVVPLGGNKMLALQDQSGVVLAVDDHPSNIKRYEAAGIPTLMVDRPWNIHHAGERIFSLNRVVERAQQLR